MLNRRSDLEKNLIRDIQLGNFRSLARAISYVENGVGNFYQELMDIPFSTSKIIGVTGPPGAGKSTLVDALIGQFIRERKKVAVLCVDPSSTFHNGALLGDRIRMSDWYNNPDVFIRSLSSRGSLGGLHPRILEITDLLKAGGFDYILIETVGVGQSEIEIAALADTTVVVLVPEGGDDIQSMKAGIMEIADIFAVNKKDRPGADLFVKNLRANTAPDFSSRHHPPYIVKTNALLKEGIDELADSIEKNLKEKEAPALKYALLAERAYYLIRNERMKDIHKTDLVQKIKQESEGKQFNLYRFINSYRY